MISSYQAKEVDERTRSLFAQIGSKTQPFSTRYVGNFVCKGFQIGPFSSTGHNLRASSKNPALKFFAPYHFSAAVIIYIFGDILMVFRVAY